MTPSCCCLFMSCGVQQFLFSRPHQHTYRNPGRQTLLKAAWCYFNILTTCFFLPAGRPLIYNVTNHVGMLVGRAQRLLDCPETVPPNLEHHRVTAETDLILIQIAWVDFNINIIKQQICQSGIIPTTYIKICYQVMFLQSFADKNGCFNLSIICFDNW